MYSAALRYCFNFTRISFDIASVFFGDVICRVMFCMDIKLLFYMLRDIGGFYRFGAVLLEIFISLIFKISRPKISD